ncbi:MAG: hypothetical protein EAZ55_01840 [Cytophagales bacterium]|nr:MAG: hypothetical protein EAZ55_01840 [Cytophagales bacterium]
MKKSFFLCFYVFISILVAHAQKNKKLTVPAEIELQEEDKNTNHQLLKTDSTPQALINEVVTNKDENILKITKNNNNKKGEKKNAKIFMGIKTKKGFAVEGEVLQKFRYPAYESQIVAHPYAQEIHCYDMEKKKIENVTYQEFTTNIEKGKKWIVLHGRYEKYRGKSLIEEGYFYKGTKQGRWDTYDNEFTLLEKLYYEKGWQADSEISYYSSDKIKEVIPKAHGTKTGKYYKFYETGTIAEIGQYEYDQKIGLWYEYYGNGRRKKQIQYPKTFAEKTEPRTLREWDAQGNLTYDWEKNKNKK